MEEFQRFLVARVIDFHNRQKLKLEFDPKLSTWHIIHKLLEVVQKEGKIGYVAQHLVGAKLELRFPGTTISNESASTADLPTKRQGDFLMGDTVFHVTAAPGLAVFEKCRQNLAEGHKVYLIVPDEKILLARKLETEICNGYVAVESLESFLSQNIDEISGFSNAKLKDDLVDLIAIYNRRIDEVEIDKSLMIELPSNLVKKYD